MLVCKVCGKKFKTGRALGGHMSTVHAHDKTPAPSPGQPTDQAMDPAGGTYEGKDIPDSNASEPEPSKTEGVVETVTEEPLQIQPADEDPGIMNNIRELRRQGYSAKQIKEQFGYVRQTVDRVFAEYIPPEAKVDETSLDQDKKRETMPAIYKKDERSNPEVLLKGLADGNYEAQLEYRGMMKLRAAMLMVIDLTSIQKAAAEADAIRLRPILDLMKETRAEQDAAAARAKESNVEIAERAAVGGADLLAERVVPEIRTLMEKQRPASTGKTSRELMFGPMAEMMGQQMANMFSGMFGMGGGQSQPGQPGGQQPQVPPGWEYEEVKGE